MIGQWLPPGAGASLLRSVSFFDGAAASGPALTLAWWAALGLGAVLLGSALKRRRSSGSSAPGKPPHVLTVHATRPTDRPCTPAVADGGARSFALAFDAGAGRMGAYHAVPRPYDTPGPRCSAAIPNR